MTTNKHRTARKATALTLALALAACPLAACGAQASDGSSATTSTASTDSSSWKTLGDLFAAMDGGMYSASYGDTSYVGVVKVGDSYYRVTATIDADTNAKIEAVDWEKGDVEEQIRAALSVLAIESIEDFTADVLTQDQLDALKGKTGKELVDEGFTFQDYFLYNGEQTGATFAKGYIAYGITFEVSTPEESTDDGGASVMDAEVVAAEIFAAADSATDPTE